MEWIPIFELNMVPYDIYSQSNTIDIDVDIKYIFQKPLYDDKNNCIIYQNFCLNKNIYDCNHRPYKIHYDKQKKKKLFHLKRNKERLEKLSNI
jgi:hypothetical protein